MHIMSGLANVLANVEGAARRPLFQLPVDAILTRLAISRLAGAP